MAAVPQSRPVPAAPTQPVVATAPANDDRRKRLAGLLLPLLPVGILALAMFVVVIRDLLLPAEVLGTQGDAEVIAEIDTTPWLALNFQESEMQVMVGKDGMKPSGSRSNGTPAFWEPAMRFGLVLLRSNDSNFSGKRLTFRENGLTNNACVRLNGRDVVYGETPLRLQNGQRLELIPGAYYGRWKERSLPLGNDPTGRPRDGRKSIWVYDTEKVEITQTVEIVPGPQPRMHNGKLVRNLDTILVRYTIENKDHRPHNVGLRFLLDTYIGANDGVPYTIPGRDQLCNDQMEFNRPEEIPDFIQALERDDLANPGTVAQIHLRYGSDLEAPQRVTLGAWPNFELNPRDNRCCEGMTLWEVPVMSMRTLNPGDSAVTLYWPERALEAGKKREVGFAYGVGQVASDSAAQGRLGLSVGGNFVVGGQFTVTALVSNPVPGESITLILPAGFELVSGNPTQTVPPAASGSKNSPVSWKVRATRAGAFPIKVQLSTGLAQTQTVNIRKGGGLFN